MVEVLDPSAAFIGGLGLPLHLWYFPGNREEHVLRVPGSISASTCEGFQALLDRPQEVEVFRSYRATGSWSLSILHFKLNRLSRLNDNCSPHAQVRSRCRSIHRLDRAADVLIQNEFAGREGLGQRHIHVRSSA
jgi:hypothetical protein